MNRGVNSFRALYLAPAVALYGLLFGWPLIQALYISLFDWSGLSQRRTFVGGENFSRLASDPVVMKSFQHNLAFLVAGGATMLAIALGLAHAVQGESRIAKLLRGVYLFPHIISMVIVAVMWKFIYNPSVGFMSKLVETTGLKSPTWLADKSTVLPSIIVAFVWYGAGFYTMLLSAGLKAIPQEVKESCELDGVIGWRRFTQVTWPLLWSIKRIAIIHIAVAAMNVFVLVFLMTSGGPDRSSEVALTYLYEQAFSNSRFGYATSLAILNLCVVLVVFSVVMFVYRRDPTEAR